MDPEPSCLRRRVDSRLARGNVFRRCSGSCLRYSRSGVGFVSRHERDDRLRVAIRNQGGGVAHQHSGDRAARGTGARTPGLPASVSTSDPLFPYPYPDCQVGLGLATRPDGSRIAFSTVNFDYPPDQAWQSHPGLSSHGVGRYAPRRSRYRGALSSARLVAGRHTVPRGAPDGGRRLGPDCDLPRFARRNRAAPGDARGDRRADWSSTGRIAFARFKPTCRLVCDNIFVTRLGGTPRRLTHRGGASPSWSPHGTKLAFVRSVRRGGDNDPRDVYLVRRDGSGLRRLTRRGGHSPAWSPDGRWIAFHPGWRPLRGPHQRPTPSPPGRRARP